MTRIAAVPAFLQDRGIENTFPPSPDSLAHFRSQHWQAFLEQGLPSRKNEYWKYSDISFLDHQQYSAAKKGDIDHLIDTIHQYRLRSGDGILMVLVNGYFMPVLSDMVKLPANVIACSMSEALQHHMECISENLPEKVDAQKYPFANLNAAMFVDGLFLKLGEACELAAPIHLLSRLLAKKHSLRIRIT